MNHLKKRVQSLPSSQKYCVLVFDEMAIAPALNYDLKNYYISGFVDNGNSRSKEFASHVLVFMVRGILKKYKQAISYSFCAGTTPTCQIKAQIKNLISRLQECGLYVVATVCDQGSTNVAAINQLPM